MGSLDRVVSRLPVVLTAGAMEIAFLGTGLMGAPMVTRLLHAGHKVRLWNRSAERARPLAEIGGILCASPAEAAQGIDWLCLCLTDAHAIETVLFGPDGAAHSLSAKATIIDFSTSGPDAARSAAARVFSDCRAGWLDCPVSGGVAGAKAGTLAILAGGDAATLDRAAPLFEPLAARVTHMGGIGAGQAAKLCNQLIVVTNLAAIAEAMALGEALGVDLAKFPQALSGGFADSLPLQLFGPRMALASDPGPSVGALNTMYKDAAAILRAAAEKGADVPVMRSAATVYAALIAQGLGAEDLPALIRFYRERAPGG